MNRIKTYFDPKISTKCSCGYHNIPKPEPKGQPVLSLGRVQLSPRTQTKMDDLPYNDYALKEKEANTKLIVGENTPLLVVYHLINPINRNPFWTNGRVKLVTYFNATDGGSYLCCTR